MNGVLLPLGAVAAGVVSATSPCVLPVLPGYVATVSGAQTPGELENRASRLAGALGFVAGFTIVFTAMGATASAVGRLLFDRLDVLLRLAGIVLILLGLRSIGVVRGSWLSRERRPVPLHRVGSGPRRAVALGAAFAIGWTPCIGPVLATILTKAAGKGDLAEGMMLLALYSLGLGVPFVAVALWCERSRSMRERLARRAVALQRLAGATMVVAGVGYVTGVWATLFTGLQAWLARSGWPPI